MGHRKNLNSVNTQELKIFVGVELNVTLIWSSLHLVSLLPLRVLNFVSCLVLFQLRLSTLGVWSWEWLLISMVLRYLYLEQYRISVYWNFGASGGKWN